MTIRNRNFFKVDKDYLKNSKQRLRILISTKFNRKFRKQILTKFCQK